MTWFVDEERPVPALVLDGLGWGIAVGCVLGFLGGVGGVLIGTPVGAVTGLLVGLTAGVCLAGWQRVGASRTLAVIGTVLPAVGPLTADVVSRVRRWRPRRVRRSPRCVVVVGRCTLVIR